MRLDRRSLLVFAVLFVAVFSAGCSKAPSNGGGKKKIVVGFSQIGAESGWRTANTKSIKEEAAARGIDLVFADAQQKQENQLKALRSFIAQGVDVIAFSPVITTGWEDVLKETKAAGIPVILTDRSVEVPGEGYFKTFIGSDFVKEGRLAGEWLAKKTGGKAVIAEFVGTPGSAPAIDRKKGFEEVLAKYPGMKILKSQSGNFTRAEGKQVFESFLKSSDGKSITALFAHNDDMALGAIQAMEEAGLKPAKDILIVSIDGVHDALQAIVDGKINCSVECNPMIGPTVYDAVEKVLRGETLPARIVIEDQVFDETNAKDALPKRAY